MKTLILVRHAKSDWNDATLSDFDRPLNERGKHDAPVMAHRLFDKKVEIDAFISSPAKRARKTAAAFAKAYGVDKESLILIEKLYHASIDTFYEVINETDNKHQHIAIFSHNAGITDFANLLTDARIDNIPTCGIFAVQADVKKWSEFRNGKKEFWFFDFPKN